ncbi:MAG: site-2 protease family protein [Thermogutta sp.]
MSYFDPHETPYNIRFLLFGIPVRVNPFFWLVAVFLGLHLENLFELLAWVLAVFIAILVHEMGHALMMRAFGFYPLITLYGLGGYTSYVMRGVGMLPPFSGERILITAAGPGVGFLFAAALAISLALLGVPISVMVGPPIGVYVVAELTSPWLNAFIGYLFFTCIAWGILNLLPVLPLDGGEIMQELLSLRKPTWGLFHAARISIVVAAAVALWAVISGSFFLAILFAYLAYSNYQRLAGPRF